MERGETNGNRPHAALNPLDLNHIFTSNELKLSPPESAEDARHRRHMEIVRFYLAMAVYLVMFAFGLYGVFNSATSAEDKKWYTGIVGLMVGGVAGYLFKGK